MEQITIRTALLADLDTLLRFEQGIIEKERPWDPTIQDGEIHYYDLAQMLTLPTVEVVVAELNGEIIGSGSARIKDSKHYQKHKQYAYLGFMYVVEQHRGKGVNQNIIEALKQWAIAQNMTELRLEVYNDNAPAVKAYEKVGFTKLMVEMRMGLEDNK